MTRKPVLLFIALVMAVVVTLAATNPSKQEYQVFLESVLAEAMERMEAGSGQREQGFIRELLRLRGRHVIGVLVSSKTVRRSFGIFSLFETSALDTRLVVLGIGPWLYPLSGQDEIMRKIGQLSF